ncbi:MAG: hypothetical protein HRT89_19965, partial [Lentisphaeria bacterium]|nr:hypothetical protein [Lentisphaeria bacterium]
MIKRIFRFISVSQTIEGSYALAIPNQSAKRKRSFNSKHQTYVSMRIFIFLVCIFVLVAADESLVLRKQEGNAKIQMKMASPKLIAESTGLSLKEKKHWLSNDAKTNYVPNTIVMIWTGDFGGMGRFAIQWKGSKRFLETEGYKVIELLPGEGQSSESILKRISELSKAKELHGIYAMGHGFPAGFGTKAWLIGPAKKRQFYLS